MSQLRELQLDFQAYVRDEDNAAVPAVVGDQRAGREERLDVYYQAYRLRLLEILRNDFSGLAALLDEQGFHALGLAYLAAHPSTHPSVRWFGRHLADFLRTAEPYCARPELTEMACFEWAWGQAFDAADSPVVDSSALEQVPWAELHVGLQASVQRIALHSNVPAVFQAVCSEESLPDVQISDASKQWMLWRRDLDIFWRSLENDEAWALDNCVDGSNLAQLCDGLCRWHDEAEVPLRMAMLLRQWSGEGLIREISVD
jgi:hypothetical protein